MSNQIVACHKDLADATERCLEVLRASVKSFRALEATAAATRIEDFIESIEGKIYGQPTGPDITC